MPVAWAMRNGGPSPPRSCTASVTPLVEGTRTLLSYLTEARVREIGRCRTLDGMDAPSPGVLALDNRPRLAAIAHRNRTEGPVDVSLAIEDD